MFKYHKTEKVQTLGCLTNTELVWNNKHHDFNMERPNAFEAVKFSSLNTILSKDKIVEPTKEEELTQADVYEDNSGTTLVLNVNNKLIIAADTRHSAEYNINSRNMTKIFKLGKFYLTTTGFYADGFEVYTVMKYQLRQYESKREITLKAAAHLLCNVLYARRFFPYYTYACLVGVENGVAGIYSFDSVGSYELVNCRCDGSSSKMIQPLLDSWISGKNFQGFQELDFDGALALVKKAFDSAAERDVRTKDYLEIYTIDGETTTHEFVDLRKD